MIEVVVPTSTNGIDVLPGVHAGVETVQGTKGTKGTKGKKGRGPGDKVRHQLASPLTRRLCR